MITVRFYNDDGEPVSLTTPEFFVMDRATKIQQDLGFSKLEICTPNGNHTVMGVSFKQLTNAQDEATNRQPLHPIIDVRPYQRPDSPALNIPAQRALQPA